MRFYFKAFQRYFESNGRASRRELWWFAVFHTIILLLLSFLDGYFGFYSEHLDYGYLTIAYLLFTAIPSICLLIRRFHDVGKSGYWWFGTRVPILNFYTFYLLYIKAGTYENNEYGTPPEHTAASETLYKAEPPYTSDKPAVDINLSLPSATPVTATPKAHYCRNCGNKLLDNAHFCTVCGTKVIEARANGN